jgi:septal ring factor EnvC (AmiA/AmiB activator)
MSDNHSHKSTTFLAAALLFFVIFQLTQILADRSSLEKAKTQISENVTQADKVLADNQKMLDQLNAIATGTQRLADAGNANAKEIVAQLGRAGIKINPNFKEDQAKAAASKAEGKPAEGEAAPMEEGEPGPPPGP